MKTQAFPTMITPFCRDGSVDTGAMRAMMDWYFENGCGGVFAACQSSEIFFLTRKERVLLTKTAVDRANELAAAHPDRPRLTVVASGHVSDRFDDQVEELKAVADAGPDTVILISNRLDVENTGDEAWIRDAERIMEALPSVPFGVYECPHPYKRMMSEKRALVSRRNASRSIPATFSSSAAAHLPVLKKCSLRERIRIRSASVLLLRSIKR